MQLSDQKVKEVIKKAFLDVLSFEEKVLPVYKEEFHLEFFEKVLPKWIEFAKEKGWDKDEKVLYGEMLKVFSLYSKYLRNVEALVDEGVVKMIHFNVLDFEPEHYEILLEAERLGLEVAFKCVANDSLFIPSIETVKDAISKVKSGWQPFEVALYYAQGRGFRSWVVLGCLDEKGFSYGDEVEYAFLDEVQKVLKKEYGLNVSFEELKELYETFLLEKGKEIEGVYVRKDQNTGETLFYAREEDFRSDLGEKLKKEFLKKAIEESRILLLSDDGRYGDKVYELLKEIKDELVINYRTDVRFIRIEEIYKELVSNRWDELDEVERKKEGYYVKYKNWNTVREWLKEEVLSEVLRQETKEREDDDVSPPSPY